MILELGLSKHGRQHIKTANEQLSRISNQITSISQIWRRQSLPDKET
jgi:hypothetical protein